MAHEPGYSEQWKDIVVKDAGKNLKAPQGDDH